MSICVTESPQSRRTLDAMHREADERAAHVARLCEEFLLAVQARDPDALAFFSPRRWPGNRIPFAWEVIHDAMDCRDFASRFVAIVMNASAGRASQRDAQALMEEVAAHWADREVDHV